MKRYGNFSRNSGVTHYEIGDGWIAVRFRSGDTYLYTARKPGRRHVAEMQKLARRGSGLSTYISRHVRDQYERKLD